MNALLLDSATRLAARIRAREVSSREVVQTHIDRIQEINPTLNAVVCTRFREALDEAERADARVQSERAENLPPLHGVPCTIKECFALEGMPNTAGLMARHGHTSHTDATAVARLRKGGAIPLGVTNVSELCMWMETNNRVYGRTNNPYDPSRIVGGSSGGEGAIIGGGGSPFGLGSDIGGSIRMPAFFNGIFGHKPTGGLVPGSGQFPLAANDALRYLTTGPLARRAEDLMPLLRLLAGPDGKDSRCRELPLGDPDQVAFAELQVLDVEDNGAIDVHPALAKAQQTAADTLRARGAQVRATSFPHLRHSMPIWSAMLEAAGGPTFAELLGPREPFRVGRELGRWVTRRSAHTLPAILLALIEPLPKLMKGRAHQFIEMGRALKQEIESAIGPRGVMLFPSYQTPAPRHYTPLAMPFAWVYTAIINVLELPATQVPLGFDERGLPVGIQVIGAPGSDHVTIAVARELERAHGGWVPPP
jgi:fatty acid amide hydrolase 2